MIEQQTFKESVSPSTSRLRIAVTGASGFVGTHLIDRLVRDGIEVKALSRNGTGRRDIEDIRVDYNDAVSLYNALEGTNVVIHLAARAHRTDERANDATSLAKYEAANVNTAQAVATATREAGLNRMVLISSIGVNGTHTTGTPFDTSSPANPTEPYAQSKWRAEQVVASVLGTGRTDYVILRPPLVYGPGCPGNFEKLINLTKRAPLLPLGRIYAPRTLIYIENLVDAIVTACEKPAISRKTYLVADGQSTSVSEIVRVLAKAMGRPRHVVIGVPPVLLAFLAKAMGKRQAWEKLSSALEVDPSAFCREADWDPPIAPSSGLFKTASAYTEK